MKEEGFTARAQELCECRGGRPGLLTVSVDVKQHWTWMCLPWCSRRKANRISRKRQGSIARKQQQQNKTNKQKQKQTPKPKRPGVCVVVVFVGRVNVHRDHMRSIRDGHRVEPSEGNWQPLGRGAGPLPLLPSRSFVSAALYFFPF